MYQKIYLASKASESKKDTANVQHIIIDNVPEKLRNKSKEEIADMYLNLEKKLGSQGQELGELRRMTDQILQEQFNPKHKSEPEPEISDDDFYANPKDSVEKIVRRTSETQAKKLDDI